MRRITVVIAAACALGIALPTAPASAAEPPADAALLFVVNGPSSTVTRDGDRFRITLDGVRTVHWFTDRPDREAGRMTASALRAKWKGYGFAADPPNAALVADSSGRRITAIVELSRPAVSGSRVTFTAVPTRRDARATAIESHAKRAARGLPIGRFTETSLFIDDAGGCFTQAEAYRAQWATVIDTLNSEANNMLVNGLTPTETFEQSMTGLVQGIQGATAASLAGDDARAQQVIRDAVLGAQGALGQMSSQMTASEVIALQRAVQALSAPPELASDSGVTPCP